MSEDAALQGHIHAILQHVDAMIANEDALNKMQHESLEKIRRNTNTFIESYESKKNGGLDLFVSYLNHEAFNYITPILGYSELVAMQAHGSLTNDQRVHMDQLCDIAYALRDELRRIHQDALHEQQTKSS